jgi:hypothetical protein
VTPADSDPLPGSRTDPLPEDPLLAARALVLHDLAVRGLAQPAVVSLLESSISERRWWLAQWPQGADYVLGLVAQDVQDAVHDSIGRWPRCTACDSLTEHSLQVTPDLGADPQWLCEASGIVVAPVGRLT